MKIFLSYKFTGEDPTELSQTIGQIVDCLRAAGNDVYCSLEDEQWFQAKKRTNREIMEHAFRELDTCDVFLAFVRANEKSEGMLIETGYAIATGKRFALALKDEVNTTSIAQMADPLITFSDLDDLCAKLSTTFAN